MTEVEVTCCLDDQSRMESQSHVDCRYDVVTAMTISRARKALPNSSLLSSLTHLLSLPLTYSLSPFTPHSSLVLLLALAVW